jgi:hypothetical protein
VAQVARRWSLRKRPEEISVELHLAGDLLARAVRAHLTDGILVYGPTTVGFCQGTGLWSYTVLGER